MSDRLVPFAVLVVLAGILVGGFVVFSSPRATTIAAAGGEPSKIPPVTGVATDTAPPTKSVTTISSARLPVPLLLSRHTTQFVEYARQPATTTGTVVTETPVTKDSSAAAAKAMIEADGYRNVEALFKAPDGAWRASARRGATEVAVSVDTSGRVSTQ